MLNALILFVFVESAATENGTIRCEFPGKEGNEKPIHVVLEPNPSLKDQPGLYRVMMELNGRPSLRALAQPITTTAERDVMIRGLHGETTLYTVGLRDDGTAALNLKFGRSRDELENKLTRTGECRGFEAHLNRWLPS
jgi:hypothetical protein